MAASCSKKIEVKLLIDSRAKRVLYAEAEKEFTDFVISILSMPVGNVVRLLSTEGMVGSLGTLYQSIANLKDTYIQPNNFHKDDVLKPQSSVEAASTTLLALTDDDTTSKTRLHLCTNCTYYMVSSVLNATCPRCSRPMRARTYVRAEAGTEQEGGFVKGAVTYMIMDDLEVKPLSTLSSIAMLNTFNVKEVDALELRTATVGVDEGLKLLKASLQTKTVLTQVFLGKVEKKLSSYEL